MRTSQFANGWFCDACKTIFIELPSDEKPLRCPHDECRPKGRVCELVAVTYTPIPPARRLEGML